MKNKNEKGFSLIELVVVCTIIGIIASISVVYLRKAKYAAENGAIFATIKIMSKEELNHYVQHQRYARLDELNSIQGGGFGTTNSNSIKRGNFTFSMSPVTPTDTDLRDDYTIIATKVIDAAEVPYVVSVSPSGEVVQLIP